MVAPWDGYNQSLNVLSDAARMKQQQDQMNTVNALAERQDQRAASSQKFNQDMSTQANQRAITADTRAGESHAQNMDVGKLTAAYQRLTLVENEMKYINPDDPNADKQYQIVKQNLAKVDPKLVDGMPPTFNKDTFLSGKMQFESAKRKMENDLNKLEMDVKRANIRQSDAAAAASGRSGTEWKPRSKQDWLDINTAKVDGRGATGKEIDDISNALGIPKKDAAEMIMNNEKMGTVLRGYSEEVKGINENYALTPEQKQNEIKATRERWNIDSIMGKQGASVEGYAKDLIKQFGGNPQQESQVPYRPIR